MSFLPISSIRRKTGRSPGKILLLAVIGMAAALLLSLSLGGVVFFSPGEILSFLRGETAGTSAHIFLYLRLPRTAAALFAGMGLAGAGVIIQTLLDNPLAGPNIIGVNAGAGFFATLTCALFPALPGIVPVGAFLGALGAGVAVCLLAEKTRASRITVVLSGVAINSILNAGTDVLHYLFSDLQNGGTLFRIGGFGTLSLRTLWPACILIGGALAVACFLHHELDILALGDETAASLGLAVRPMRTVFLILAACMAGAAVSFAGLLGFIGLLIPHCARFLVGSRSKYLLPLSAVLGGGALTVCDILARVLFRPYEIPVGILISFVGAPPVFGHAVSQKRRA